MTRKNAPRNTSFEAVLNYDMIYSIRIIKDQDKGVNDNSLILVGISISICNIKK